MTNPDTPVDSNTPTPASAASPGELDQATQQMSAVWEEPAAQRPADKPPARAALGPGNADRPARPDRPERVERPERPDRADQTERADRPGRADSAGPPGGAAGGRPSYGAAASRVSAETAASVADATSSDVWTPDAPGSSAPTQPTPSTQPTRPTPPKQAARPERPAGRPADRGEPVGRAASVPSPPPPPPAAPRRSEPVRRVEPAEHADHGAFADFADFPTDAAPGGHAAATAMMAPVSPTFDDEDERPVPPRQRSAGKLRAAANSASRFSPPARPAAGGARQARLRLARLDPWSVMKVTFLLSIALGVITMVAVIMLWLTLDVVGVFDQVGATVQSVTGTGGAAGADNGGFNLRGFLSLPHVLGFTVLVAIVDVVLVTALATLGAYLYNLSAGFAGGIEVTLAEEDG